MAKGRLLTLCANGSDKLRRSVICTLFSCLLICAIAYSTRDALALETTQNAFGMGQGISQVILDSSDSFQNIAHGNSMQYWDQQANGDEPAAPEDANASSGQEQPKDNQATPAEPSSEVVTTYYHDAWSEASKAEEEEVVAAEEAQDAKSKEENDQAEEEPEAEELDPELNDLGDENYINLQQTPDNSFMYDNTIFDLVNGTDQDQKKTVQVRGEVVGEAVRAEQDPGKYWITLDSEEEDKEASISVLVDKSALGMIDTYGGYNRTGTILRVNGTFFISCTSHEGIMDIHADEVTVISQGSEAEDELIPQQFIPGLMLCFLGLILTVLYKFLAERQR